MLKTKLKQIPPVDFKAEFKTFSNSAIQKLFGVSQDWYKNRDIVKNNYQLGVRFLKQGEAQDAVMRFTLTTWFAKNYAEAWLGLGRAYLLSHKRAKAERALGKALEINPALELAKKTQGAIPKIYDAATPVTKITKGDATQLAALHRESFVKSWDEKAFADMLVVAGTEAWINGLPDLPMGMIVGRALGEQYEILTLTVNPEWRSWGLAKQLLETLTARAKETGANTIFLEVQEDNKAARKFYQVAGYDEVNRRKDYYRQEDGSYKDAVVMRRELA
jgi:ribosomal-protein-alanine N-acetyltransferase